MGSSGWLHFASPPDGTCLIFHRDKQKHTATSLFLGIFRVLWFVPVRSVGNRVRHVFLCYGYSFLPPDPPGLEFRGFLQERGRRSSFCFTTVK